MFRQPPFLVPAIGRWLCVAIMAVVLTCLVPSQSQAAALLGSATIDRLSLDNSPAQVFIYAGGTFDRERSMGVFTWLGYSFAGSRYYTPVLFEEVADDLFVVRGVGTGRTVQASPSPQSRDFAVAFGTDVASNANFTFGFINALVNGDGVPTASSAGNIDWSDGVDPGPGAGGAGTTNRWVFTPTLSNIVVALGTSFGRSGSGADFRINTGSGGEQDRTYSAQLTSEAGIHLLLNGSFEEGVDPGIPLNQGSNAINNWTVTRGQIDYVGPYWQPAAGNRSLDLNGSPGQGGVAQYVPTQPGRSYLVTFAMSGNPAGGPTIKTMRVEAAQQHEDFAFDITGHSCPQMGWEYHTWSFAAIDSVTYLEFYSTTPYGAYGPALDDVSMVENSPPAPILHWASTPGFETDGIDPNSGNANVPIEYRITYVSPGNIPPRPGHPHVTIEADDNLGTQLPGEGTFSMSPVGADDDYTDGRVYRFETQLPFLPGHDYEYAFSASDTLGQPATGDPTGWLPGPQVNAVDLSIFANDILFSPSHADTGEVFTIEARVTNNSYEAVHDVNVHFYDEETGVLIDSVRIATAPAGLRTSAICNYVYHEPGFYPVRVVVDACCPQHEEWNELNNNAVRGLLVGEYSLPAWIEIDGSFTDPICVGGTGWATGRATYAGVPIPDMRVRGAEVTVRLQATGQLFTGTTNDEGDYEVEVNVGALPVGASYAVEVAITDFTVDGETTHAFEIVYCPALADLTLDLDFDADCFLSGETRPLTGMVSNTGVLAAEDFVVRIYGDGALHYEHSVDFLDAGNSYVLPGIPAVHFTTGQTPTWHQLYGLADADHQVDEYREDNNIESPTFLVWPACPDALASSIYFSDATPRTDQRITIAGTVTNMGGGAFSGPLAVAFYDSLAGATTELQSLTMPAPCPCGGHIYPSIDHQFPEVGTHMIRLWADPQGTYAAQECLTENNTLDCALPVHEAVPDFVACYQDLRVDNPSAVPGDSIRFMAQIRNVGETGYASSVPVRFLLDGAPLLPEPVIAGGIPLGQARACTTGGFWSGQWAIDPDSHFVRVEVDPQQAIPELYEFNNAAECRLLDFRLMPITDCGMFQDTQDPVCNEVLVDDEVEIHAWVENTGCLAADDNIEVRVYDEYGGEVTLLGNAWIEGLGDHEDHAEVHVDHAFAANEVGVHIVRVWIDEDGYWDGQSRWAEYTRGNNVMARPLRVVQELPDLVIESQHINPSHLTPCTGDSVRLTLTVFNEGLADAGEFHVRTNIDDEQFGPLHPVPALGHEAPNYVSFLADSVWVIEPEDAGPHAVWVITDCLEQVAELSEDNNEATRVILVCEDVPDLYVLDREISVQRISETGGGSVVGRQFILRSIVHNAGGRTGSAEARFYYRTSVEDSVLIGSDEVHVLPQGIDTAEILWIAAVDSCVISVWVTGEEEELNYTNNGASAPFLLGEMMAVGEPAASPLPRLTRLYPNAPNPFGLSTAIRFDLPSSQRVALRVYDVQGRLVRSLLDGALPAGHYALRWDGRNDGRAPVGSGVYFCRMTTAGFEAKLKLVLMK